jgi:hypothetical protein
LFPSELLRFVFFLAEDMAAANGAAGAVLFSEEDLREVSGVRWGEDFVEVTCGCTSHRYGDAVGRLRVFASGDLEINCECTPGCREGPSQAQPPLPSLCFSLRS